MKGMRKRRNRKIQGIPTQYIGKFEGVMILEIAKLKVSGTSVEVVCSQLIPAGLVGGYITVEYADALWEGITKTVVFQGCVTKDVITGINRVVIPQEVVARANQKIRVGFYGTKEDGTIAIPTVYGDLGVVVEAAAPSNDPAADPSLPIWAQLAERMENLETEASAEAVCYTRQELTEEQQEQARQNIGALSEESLEIILTDAGGTNILPPDEEPGYVKIATGELTDPTTAHKRTVSRIPLRNCTQLYVTWSDALNTVSTGKHMIDITFFTEDDTYLGYKASYCGINGDQKYKFTVPVPANATHFRLDITTGTNYQNKLFLSDLCVSYDPVAVYEPYVGVGGKVIKTEALHPDAIKMFAPLQGKTIVNFGDSIFGKRRPPEDISTELAKLTGATVHNCGFGGCHMSNHWSSAHNPFSMCNLADAIVTGDWTAQDASVAITGDGAVPSYFATALNILKELDFSKVDIITIAYGTNDFTSGDALDNAEDSLSKDTYAGALRYSIETLLTAYPNLKIFLCSQTYRFWMDESNVFTADSDTKVMNGKKLTDFVAKTEEIAREYHLPYIDNYYGLGFNKFNRSAYFSETDGTHPLPAGCKRIAENVAKKLF